MDTRIIKFGSAEYEEMLQLRKTALLEPIGIPFHYIVPEKEKNDVFIAASEEGEIIGCCVLTRLNPQLVQLRQMAVSPGYQGRGIGATVLSFAESVAKAHGFTTMMMHARDPVWEFYAKQGYEVYGEPFQEVGMGHHKMQKQL